MGLYVHTMMMVMVTVVVGVEEGLEREDWRLSPD